MLRLLAREGIGSVAELLALPWRTTTIQYELLADAAKRRGNR